jgi:hypothetical protein
MMEVPDTGWNFSPLDAPRRFSRRCLENLPVGQIERAHLVQVALGKSAPETGGQISGKSGDDDLTIFSPISAHLFHFHEPTADPPVGRRHDRIHSPRGGAAGLFDQTS